MSTQYTPGPWHAAIHAEGLGIVHPHANGPYWIADVIYHQPDGACETANALLIAAAPDLLSALRTLLGEVEGCACVSERQARAAIAKAIGGPA